VNIWRQLTGMNGHDCYTLTQDRPAKISVDSKGVTINYPSGNLHPIPRKMLEEAWNMLLHQGQLTGNEVYEMTGKDRDRTDRILAVLRMLLGVTYDKSPRVLYFESGSDLRRRKYGASGESSAHQSLKEWCAANPQFLELEKGTQPGETEYRFISGDSADIMFVRGKQLYAVVEIETNNCFPGAYQSLKYKALTCAENGFPIDSKNVLAILVAWSIPRQVRSFCDKYSIKWFEKKI